MKTTSWILLLFLSLIIILIPLNGNVNLNGYIEAFSKNNSHIDMPLTSIETCTNKCGPPGVCSISGEDCLADKDCHGCRPSKGKKRTQIPIPEEDAGKDFSILPYSTLTHDIANKAALLSEDDKYSSPPEYYQGVNMWSHSYNVAGLLYNKRYNSVHYEGAPKYPQRQTLSGEFPDNSPTSSNAYLFNKLGYNY